MKMKYLIQPIFIAAWISAVLQNIPLIKNFSIFLIIPNAPIIATYLLVKANTISEKIKYNKILTFSLLTGIIAAILAALFDIIITFITKTNDIITSLPEVESIINQLPSVQQSYLKETISYLYKISNDISIIGFSIDFVFLSLANFILINLFFSVLGSFFTSYYTNNIIIPNLNNKGE
ncbi:MAG TPA: hypothetical protein PLI27_08255 [Ignavibacteriales bacterium]|nr:hypothetical protein [Ignavibacteriales bacterium]